MLSEHLEKLIHFVGTVKNGSIRRYATKRNISQPNVSNCLQRLEASLEVTLFTRSRDGIRLTQAGHELFDWADRLLSEAARIETSIRSYGNLRLNGELRVGTYHSIAVYFLPKFFRFIQKEQSDLRFHFFTARSSELVKMLRAGHVDCIISIDPPDSRELYSQTLFEDQYSLYRATSSNCDFKSSKIFTVPEAMDRSGISIDAYMRRVKAANRMVSCGDFELAKAMVEEGMGLALLPERVASPLLDRKIIEKVRLPTELSHLGPHLVSFSCKKNRAEDESLKWVAKQLLIMLGKGT